MEKGPPLPTPRSLLGSPGPPSAIRFSEAGVLCLEARLGLRRASGDASKRAAEGRGDQMLTYSAGPRVQGTPLSMGEGVWALWKASAGTGVLAPLKLDLLHDQGEVARERNGVQVDLEAGGLWD